LGQECASSETVVSQCEVGTANIAGVVEGADKCPGMAVNADHAFEEGKDPYVVTGEGNAHVGVRPDDVLIIGSVNCNAICVSHFRFLPNDIEEGAYASVDRMRRRADLKASSNTSQFERFSNMGSSRLAMAWSDFSVWMADSRFWSCEIHRAI
jgi:hypothetical protein